jgi:hypothetical protein
MRQPLDLGHDPANHNGRGRRTSAISCTKHGVVGSTDVRRLTENSSTTPLLTKDMVLTSHVPDLLVPSLIINSDDDCVPWWRSWGEL